VEENTNTLADALFAVKTLNVENAAFEIRTEMFKALKRKRILLPTRVCQVTWRSGRATKIVKLR